MPTPMVPKKPMAIGCNAGIGSGEPSKRAADSSPGAGACWGLLRILPTLPAIFLVHPSRTSSLDVEVEAEERGTCAAGEAGLAGWEFASCGWECAGDSCPEATGWAACSEPSKLFSGACLLRCGRG